MRLTSRHDNDINSNVLWVVTQYFIVIILPEKIWHANEAINYKCNNRNLYIQILNSEIL